MTLGEHIQLLRKKKNLSQEDIGAILGVSRQAVSKWETDQTLPDTGNLLALAELLGVSADELAGRKQEQSLPPDAETDALPQASPSPQRPPRRRALLRWSAAAAVICGLAVLIFALSRIGASRPGSPSGSSGDSSAVTPAESSAAAPDVADLSEFSLFWFDHGVQKELSLGSQSTLWDFGQELATYSAEGPVKTDWPGTVVTDYICSAPETVPPSLSTFSVRVMSVDNPDDPPRRDSIIRLATTAEPFTTPRGIHPGSSEEALLLAYGDALLYSMKESGTQEELLCTHNYFYIYNEGGTKELIFYISNSAVVGIALQDWLDGTGYTVNQTTVFPVKNGTPDFSQRIEPEREAQQDATLLVYHAFYALGNDANLSPDDIYQYRRQLFSNLSGMDWQVYGDLTAMVSAYDDQNLHNTQADEGRAKLLSWLRCQETYSRDELLWLQLGSESNLDGWMAEDYSAVLCHAFFLDPTAFAQLLADDRNNTENARQTVLSTAYDADFFPEKRSAAVEQLRASNLSGRELAWAEYLISVLESPLEETYTLPLPDGAA